MLDKRENRLLAALHPADYDLVRPHLSTARFEQGAILQEQETPVAHVCFPMNGLVSLGSVVSFLSLQGRESASEEARERIGRVMDRVMSASCPATRARRVL